LLFGGDGNRKGRARGKDPVMYRLLMAPSNAICDALGLSDENERGTVRMLVNMLLWTIIGVVGATLTIGLLGK
jgi:hypothetical protein